MMKKIKIEEFQKNFDNFIQKVETGECFIVENEKGKSVVVTPCNDDLIRIHTEHNDAC